MKKLSVLFLFGLLISCNSTQKQEDKVDFSVEKAKSSLDFVVRQYQHMIAELPDTLDPRTFQGDTMVYANIYWWTSGFYPGCLWYLYEYTKDESFKTEAHERTMRVEPIKHVTDNHDLGFMLYCSFGNGLRLTGNEEYKDILLTGAESLASRFDSTVACIKSWDWDGGKEWQCPVIIDNMMNLEFLMWASEVSGNEKYKNISLTHANTTIKHHFREDYSTFHVVDYDTVTGEPRQKHTHQGYSDESAWARGQSWGLYGYSMMYREAKEKAYLDQAVKIADFLLNHPNLPEDKIPYWDYNAPDIPDAKRDASAGAIMASALLELSTFTEGEKSKTYFNAAEKMLSSLASDAYLSKEGENGNFILKHSVGHLPGNSEVDVPLTYADYYFIEALLRYIDLNKEV